MPLLAVAQIRYVLLVLDEGPSVLTPLLRAAYPTPAAAPEIVTCSSSAEVEVRLRSGRRYSAVVSGADDRITNGELALAAQRAGTPLLAVSPGPQTTPDGLRALIAATATPVPRAGWWSDDAGPSGEERGGRLVAVCGPGGTGTSTVAAGLAAGLAAAGCQVLLADFALHADQAAIHGWPELPPEAPSDLLSLIETCRRRKLQPGELQERTGAAAGYWLLKGLRRPRHWTAVRPSAFDAVLDGCCNDFAVVVADLTGDFEGEADVGSIDVEERNHMARRVVRLADVIVVVGGPGMLGTRRLTLTIDDLLDHGVDPARLQPVVNRLISAPEPLRLCGLPQAAVHIADLGSRATATPPPAWLVIPLLPAVTTLLKRLPHSQAPIQIAPVEVGSLGCSRIVSS